MTKATDLAAQIKESVAQYHRDFYYEIDLLFVLSNVIERVNPHVKVEYRRYNSGHITVGQYRVSFHDVEELIYQVELVDGYPGFRLGSLRLYYSADSRD